MKRAALYMRLSQEDRGADESQSIGNQRRLLQGYAKAHGLETEEYIDDGYSGVSFDRPAFKRMIADVEAGRIGLVVTKDLSRLGRNYTESGYYQEIFFPEHGVRYVALGEGYDSDNECSTQCAPWMNVANEQYAKDISRKIRASLSAKMTDGQYVSAFAVYGYRKDPDAHNRLLVDEAAAPVVRLMFRLALEGLTPSAIAGRLNGEGVPPPLQYRRLRQGGTASSDAKWTPSSISKILRSAVYMGCTVQGKTRKASYKSERRRPIPRADWIVCDDRHEALVDRATFEAVQASMARRRCAPDGTFANLLAGVAFCADCGARMSTAISRKQGRAYRLCCGRYKQGGSALCTHHFTEYEALCALLLREILRLLQTVDVRRELVKQASRQQQPQRASSESVDALRTRIAELDSLIRHVYEDHLRGRLSDERCEKLTAEFEREQAALQSQLALVRQEQTKETPCLDAADERLAQPPERLTRELLTAFVRRVDLSQGEWLDGGASRRKRQRIHIVWKTEAPDLSHGCAWGLDATPSE